MTAWGGAAVRLLDSRLLTWMLVLVFATGLPLMVWFDGDASASASSAASAAHVALRGLHAVSTAGLALGTLAHLVVRLRGRVPARAVRSGGWALASVGFAAATGAVIDQTGHGEAALRLLGLGGGAVVAAAVVHIAYATVLVTLTIYLHVARKPLERVFGTWVHGAFAALLVVAGVLAWPGVAPGAAWGHPATVFVAPWGVAWALVLGVAVVVGARWLAKW